MLRFLFSSRLRAIIADQTPYAMAQLIADADAGSLRAAVGWTEPLAEAIPALIELETKRLPEGKLVTLP